MPAWSIIYRLVKVPALCIMVVTLHVGDVTGGSNKSPVVQRSRKQPTVLDRHLITMLAVAVHGVVPFYRRCRVPPRSPLSFSSQRFISTIRVPS